MVNRIAFLTLSLALILVADRAAAEDEAGPPAAATPYIHHAPLLVANNGEDLLLTASFVHPDRMRKALVLYRRGPEIVEIPFRRSAADNSFIAVIPAVDVAPPTLAYAIEIETLDGTRAPSFASRAAMHNVEILRDGVDAQEETLLANVQGRRSVVSTSGEYVYFGTTDAQVQVAGGPTTTTVPIRDQYYRVEAAYTYRILRTVAEFGIRAGTVRGQSVVPGERDQSKDNVGLNYGAPRLRLRAVEWLHFEAEFLTSVTEIGFSLGGGGAILLGDAYGSKLTVGFESIQIFGTRGYSRLDLPLSKRLTVAPIIELTDMPHADRTGVRLLSELRIELGAGFGLGVRGGYQARTYTNGGPSAGTAVSYAF